MLLAHAFQMDPQGLHYFLRKQCYAIFASLPVSNKNLSLHKIHILDTQTTAIQQPHLQPLPTHRFLLKKGRTWFWKRSATALVWVPW